MKIIKTLLLGILVLCVTFSIALWATGNGYIFRAFSMTYLQGHSTANIYDYKDHTNRTVTTTRPSPWKKHPLYNQLSLPEPLTEKLDTYQTTAIVVIKDGQLLLEQYWLGHDKNTISNSFSIAKSVTTMLLFAAIEDGFVRDIDQPITDFLPEYKHDSFGKHATLGDLSAMTSGYDWDEHYYLPLNMTAKSYYGSDIEEQILSRKFRSAPNGSFLYLSGATQMLGIALERAIGQSLSEYLSKKVWQPLGMEHNALWSLDANGKIEKAFCCLNATARDFAKLGQLMLNNGQWEGTQVLTENAVKVMTSVKESAFNDELKRQYGHSIWVDDEHTTPFYAMLGHLGQRVISIPSENLVIVRIGHLKDPLIPEKGTLPNGDIYYLVSGVLEMLK